MYQCYWVKGFCFYLQGHLFRKLLYFYTDVKYSEGFECHGVLHNTDQITDYKICCQLFEFVDL